MHGEAYVEKVSLGDLNKCVSAKRSGMDLCNSLLTNTYHFLLQLLLNFQNMLMMNKDIKIKVGHRTNFFEHWQPLDDCPFVCVSRFAHYECFVYDTAPPVLGSTAGLHTLMNYALTGQECQEAQFSPR